MAISIKSLSIPDVKIITPAKFEDERGYLSETYSQKALQEVGIDLDFVQDNQSLSRQTGTVRGLHYQRPPFEQIKLVRVLRGRILDVAVDIRRSSPTFGQWVATEMSAADWSQILVPAGFAHGICTLEPDTEIYYKVTNFYAPAHDCGIRWDDPHLGISWPLADSELMLSPKDRALPCFEQATYLFD